AKARQIARIPRLSVATDRSRVIRWQLPDKCREAAGAIGESFVSDDIEDYDVDPFELGYGFHVGWKKSDFIGKDAIVSMKDAPTNRKKVTFEWNREDVLNVIASVVEGRTPYKWIDFPMLNYPSSSADMLLQDDEMVGMNMFTSFGWNERCVLSLVVVDQDIEVGDVLTLKWGEPEPMKMTSTEAHRQADIRVRASPCPFANEARENYAESWRTRWA
ncbi:MAG: aminomethyl transferase family protein, partial [Rhodobacteraceae bacterium]|nr:aminomethyl transferase family protein [Paracoccaceae bacterium]